MTKDKQVFGLLLIGAVLFFGLKYFAKPFSPQQFIDEVRTSSEPTFATLNRQIQEERNFTFRLDSLIANKDFNTANQLIDSSRLSRSTKLDYRGRIAFAQGKLKESLDFFNEAMGSDSIISISFAHRAEVLREMKLYDKAISDYRKMFGFNYDFSLQLAETFKLKGDKDSAIKYYNLYLDHYPEDEEIRKKLNSLENGG